MEKKKYQKPEIEIVKYMNSSPLLEATSEQLAPPFVWDDNENSNS